MQKVFLRGHTQSPSQIHFVKRFYAPSSGFDDYAGMKKLIL